MQGVLLPYGFLRSAAAASDATVKAQKSGGKQYTVISFTGSNKAAVHGYLDGQKMLEKVEKRSTTTSLATSNSTPHFPITKTSAA